MKASLSNYRQSPRKTRLVTNLVKGKSVPEALQMLTYVDKRAALPVKKLIESAVKNAREVKGVSPEQLFIKNFVVDKGIVFKRFMPRARGSAAPIRKRTSHLSVVLGEASGSEGKKKKGKKQVA